MCGIFGFVATPQKPIHSSVLDRCVDTLAHRGPDAEGMVGWDAAGVRHSGRGADGQLVLGLGHRRLAIFDLSDAGIQPMRSARGEWIVYNGEIYNFPELRDELRTHGHTFATGTDTEVVLTAYRQWGADCVARFNGMWALALYDPEQNGLFFSRDRLGIKPFYYVRRDGLFCFASEVQAIFSCLGQTPPIDTAELAKYLVFRGSDDGQATIYSGVRELRGGHSAWLDLATGDLQKRSYWSLPEDPDLEIDDRQVFERFSELFEDAVRLRLRADVPVAITLSGGIDSSAVTVAASRVGAGEILTFTSSFPDHPEIDETDFALEVAKTCGARSILVRPDLSRLLHEEPLLTKHQAMPYGSLSLYVHWAILNRIQEAEIPVVLCGQGGDELFVGYEPYYVPQILSLWPNVPRMLADAVLGGLRSRLGLTGMIAYLGYFGSSPLRRATLLRSVRNVYRPDLLAQAREGRSLARTSLRELQKQELLGGQLSRLLRYDDRTTSGHGMETRLPFLDYRLVEFAYRLPWRHKIRRGWTKYLLRRYLETHLSGRVAWRKSKLGFNAPNQDWTRRLIEHRGRELDAHPFGRLLLRDGTSLQALPSRPRPDVYRGRKGWDVYHVLHLAALLDWRDVAA